MQDRETSAGSSSDTAGSSSSSSLSARCSVSSTSSSGSTVAKAHAAASSAASASSTTAPANPSPPKKTRSQSPGAVQRRRIQNRIAQRNHRKSFPCDPKSASGAFPLFHRRLSQDEDHRKRLWSSLQTSCVGLKTRASGNSVLTYIATRRTKGQGAGRRGAGSPRARAGA